MTAAESAEDAEIIVRLLSEQAGSTKALVRDVQRTRQRLLVEWAFVVLGLIATVLSGASLGSPNSPTEGASFWLVYWVIVGLFFVTLAAWLYFDLRRNRYVQEDVRIEAAQLQRLIRAASQFQEHGGLSFARNLELDMALVEAEQVLLIWERVASTTINPFGTPRHVSLP